MTDEGAAMDASAERQARVLARSRLVFLLLAVVLPAALYALFDRQARRLDALGARGEATVATATRVTSQYVDYAYSVGGRTFTWNARRSDLPAARVGETFAIVYSPEDPALSRPGPDRAKGSVEASSNRALSQKVVAGLFAFFGVAAVLCDAQLRRIRATGRAEVVTPRGFRWRLAAAGVLAVAMLLAVSGWHWSEARRAGESTWPVVAGFVVVLAIAGATALHVLREGSSRARERAAGVLRWTVPIAVGLAALRALAALLGW